MNSDSDYYDISIATNIDAANLVSLLDDHSLLGSWEDEGTIHLYWPVHAWDKEKLHHLTELLQQLSQPQGDFTIEIARCPPENWNAKWAALVTPIRIGHRLLIRPSWKAVSNPSDMIEIILDPKRAFGTGHHATTQLLLEWMEEIIGGKEGVLDIGTGTGILAMVALKLGASSALGIDNDPVAIECAREYAEVNGLDKKLQLFIQDLADLDTQYFDLILANLDRQTLLNLATHLQRVKSPETLLLLSGILLEDQIDVTKFFVKMGWALFGFRERDGWLALGFKSSSSK